MLQDIIDNCNVELRNMATPELGEDVSGNLASWNCYPDIQAKTPWRFVQTLLNHLRAQSHVQDCNVVGTNRWLFRAFLARVLSRECLMHELSHAQNDSTNCVNLRPITVALYIRGQERETLCVLFDHSCRSNERFVCDTNNCIDDDARLRWYGDIISDENAAFGLIRMGYFAGLVVCIFWTGKIQKVSAHCIQKTVRNCSKCTSPMIKKTQSTVLLEFILHWGIECVYVSLSDVLVRMLDGCDLICNACTLGLRKYTRIRGCERVRVGFGYGMNGNVFTRIPVKCVNFSYNFVADGRLLFVYVPELTSTTIDISYHRNCASWVRM